MPVSDGEGQTLKQALPGENEIEADCSHCWHSAAGPLLMVMPDGGIAQRCCKCQMRGVIDARFRED